MVVASMKINSLGLLFHAAAGLCVKISQWPPNLAQCKNHQQTNSVQES